MPKLFRVHITLADLGNIGLFAGGLAALIGVFWAGTIWKQHQRIKRSQSATLVLSKVRICIRDITEIGLKRHGHQHASFNQLKIEAKEEKPHPELPPRLIAHKIDQLNRDVDEAIVAISGTASKGIFELLSELEQYSWHLCPAIHADLDDNKVLKKLSHTREVLNEFPSKLKKIQTDMEMILTPIIESGDQ